MSQENLAWRQYICLACGLIYDEELGDPDSGLAPGTRFEDIPDDWECPLCGVTKTDFALYEQPVVQSAATAQQTSLPKQEGIVIVGGGIAGWSVVEQIRALNTEVPITLISACSAHRYQKPELSIALSRQLSKDKLIRETGQDCADRLGVRLLSSTFVVGLTPSLKQIRTTRGTLTYTQMVLAQGSHAVVPETIPEHLCWRVNHLDGWSGLQQHLANGPQKVAIIGAGMVGCELAEDIRSSGHDVTLFDISILPLSNILPEYAAKKLADTQQQLGIQYHGETVINQVIERENGQKSLLTDKGEQFTVDHVIVATGLSTDSRLAKAAGLTFDKGIQVDPQTLRTSNEHIFALGDCVSIHGHPCRFIEPISRQASTIAHALLNKDTAEYQHHQPIIRLKTRALPIELHGFPDATGQWEVVTEANNFLLMQQKVNGQLISTLRVGKEKKAA